MEIYMLPSLPSLVPTDRVFHIEFTLWNIISLQLLTLRKQLARLLHHMLLKFAIPKFRKLLYVHTKGIHSWGDVHGLTSVRPPAEVPLLTADFAKPERRQWCQ